MLRITGSHLQIIILFFYNKRENGLGLWFVYDSLNRPEQFLNYIKPCLKRLNVEAKTFYIISSNVEEQFGLNDCGLFALAYAIAICEGKDPAKLLFHQISMRHHFNDVISGNELTQFKNTELKEKIIKYSEHYIDISNIILQF